MSVLDGARRVRLPRTGGAGQGALRWAAMAFLVLMAVLCFGSTLWTHLGILPVADGNNLLLRNSAPGTAADGSFHVLGTDPLGRDVLSRMAEGGRISLTIGICTVLLSGVVGTLVGVLAGYCKGWVDNVIMRLVDVQLAFPGILLALFVIYIIGPGFGNLVFVLAIAQWPVVARLARSITLSMRERQFIAAARVGGARAGAIILREIVPNVLSPVIALLTIEFSAAMIGEAGLSFIGFGVQPPDSSWGLMLADGRDYLTSAWWLVVCPGLAIALTALAVNLLTNVVKEAVDPLQRSSGTGRRRPRAEAPATAP